MREKAFSLRSLRSTVLLAPLFGVGLLHCTLSGLTALGDGAGDAGPVEDANGSKSEVIPDAGIDTATSPTPPADSSTPPPGDSGGTGPVTDASSDATDSASPVPPALAPIWLDAGSQSWCDLHQGYAFCADFDETPLPAGFSASDGAFLTQTSSNASSGPNDLLLYVPPQGGTSTWGSKLSRQFTTNGTSMVLAFDIDPEVLNVTSSGMLFAGLDFLGNATAKYSIRLAFNEGVPRLEESYLGSPADVYHSNFVLASGVWSRIQVEITFPATGDAGGGSDAGTATESVYVNGVLQGTPEQLTPPAGFDQAPNLLIGAVYGTSPTDAWGLRYDNVTFDIQ
jgi:hypothetical protein